MSSRAYANPIEDRSSLMPASAQAVSLPLTGPQALLIHQILNEILHGIRGIQALSQVGLSKLEMKVIFDHLNAWLRTQQTDANGLPLDSLDRSFSASEIRVLRNSIELVMLDLGQHEFQTRTGFTLSEAAELLNKLNSALIDTLHIDHRVLQPHGSKLI